MDRDFLFAIAMDEQREGSIPKVDLIEGISGDDPELAGAVYDIITTDRLKKRIEPPLADEELENLLMPYFERCILTDPKGEWTLTRYSAAWEAQGCMLKGWDNDGGSSKSFARWKKWMERLYRAGDEAIKRAIVDGILEHLFEKKGLRQFFADWKADSELKTAYEEAQLWADTQSKNAQPAR
ncbi:MAG: hypothetical protein DMG91_13315 [Acidobacteria bacterium]|jgi:hypothetical protein|nr:MAG: hypothetical protein DMG91_13315 [Acidobacteriota bacterium]